MATRIVLSLCGQGFLACQVMVMGICGGSSCLTLTSFLLCDTLGEVQVTEPGMFVLYVGDDFQPNRSLQETNVPAIV